MSNISDRHVFVTYKSSGSDKTSAYAGQRLSVVRFKAGKNGAKLRNSQAVSIPVASLTAEDMVNMQSHITSWFHSVQDEVIREACVAGRDSVSTSDIDVASIKQYLVSQAAGDRLTGDSIKEWFDSELADMLLLAFAEKMGIGDEPTEEQTKKLEQMVNVYRDKLASMAGGRTMYDGVTRSKLEKALQLVDCSDGIGAKLAGKLKAMSEVSVEEMLGL